MKFEKNGCICYETNFNSLEHIEYRKNKYIN